MLNRMHARRIICYYMFHLFTNLLIDAQDEKIIYNHGLETKSCLSSISDLSYTECLNHFRNNKTHINVMVYRRRFRLCDTYFVTGTISYKQEPGSMLAYRPVTEQKDCLALFEKGCKDDGMYTIIPVGGLSIQAWCDMTNGGWTVIQRRLDGSENFYRTWTDYVCGFGNRSGEYWLGLENIYWLTTIDSSLKIEMEAFEDVSSTHADAQYHTFRVDDEDSNFTLHVSGFSGNCGDSLIYHDGKMFTTKDRDNDEAKYNCAQKFKGGWWYKGCHASNLNGLYLSGNHSTYADGINWHSCWGHYYSIRSVVMKVKRNFP
ncbi:microfibril-associated glycoprotein 4-like [Ruditapes philippinarum]|uniref:microfibril-associated glycoprotein 4-like n=1 Tax=Ruditapes philippinarum TaxID=129788 RepID=UPI00295BC43A|nr:microfibril-associated glycoprotein 4-like [Ruditapes philippinarum]